MVVRISSKTAATAADRRVFVASVSGLVVAYSVAVLWYVATFPDIGVRCLLPHEPDEYRPGGVEIRQFSQTSVKPAPQEGNRLISVNRHPVNTFLDVIDQMVALRSAKIPPGGQLPPGSDPAELTSASVPGLVEIYGADSSAPSERLVELQFRVPASSQPDLVNRVYVPVRPVPIYDISLTIIWFVCQLAILSVAFTAYWIRPFDRIAQNFCLMCCFSMGAFVGGFHWWMLVGNPLLNIPFILCATILPSMVLNFFLVFPEEPEFYRDHRGYVKTLIFSPTLVMAAALVVAYWSSWCLNGRSDDNGVLNAFQKLAVVSKTLATGAGLSPDLIAMSTGLLYVLRVLVQVAIVVGSVCFVGTVVQLSASLMRIQSPRERRQVMTILLASLAATIPIAYTLYLAFFRKVEFALGKAQLPMFIASMLFMAAYAHGMLRHRLMLTDDASGRSRRYELMSLLVSGGFATCLALSGITAHAYNLPLNLSTAQQIGLFLILLLAAALTLWLRDRLQGAVDRWYFSEKYQLDRTRQQLNRVAGYLADPGSMAELTLRTCQDIIDAASASMYAREASGGFRLIGSRAASPPAELLRADQIPARDPDELVIQRVPSMNRESMSPAQRLLHDLKAELVCFLEDENGLHGLIVIGRRREGTAYTAEDIAFLHAMGQMSVLALHSSQAHQTMARHDAELKVKMERIADQQRQLSILRAELTNLQVDAGQSPASASDTEFNRGGIRGNSPALVEILNQVRKIARSPSTALIRGESGTGKESLARVIHLNSDRAAAPLVCVNCAALSSSLLESELFGHVKGAFTGAHADKVGRFLSANGGTLFLDEIGDISAETQVKLLRVLQERCFEPVGSDKTIQIDVRLIAATNRNLEDLIAQGQFREDLYYRLNVVTLTLPPLRERRDDLIELLFLFLNRYAQKSRKQIRQVDPDALAALEHHPWPGNIRELENAVERAVLLADSDIITLADLPAEIRRSARKPPVTAASKATSAQLPTTAELGVTAADSWTARTITIPETIGSDEEERLLRDVLRAAAGNKAQAARRLNLPRSTFYSKCKKYGIQ